MTYYKVKPQYDNTMRIKINPRNNLRSIDGILVKNELYTEKEMAKIDNDRKMFDKVEISKNNTYWFFGARFEM